MHVKRMIRVFSFCPFNAGMNVQYGTMPVAFFAPYRLNILTYVIGAGGGSGRAIYINTYKKHVNNFFFYKFAI
jgi:hypothetical protein